MASTAKRVGKDIIGYPEDPVPVVSSRDWVRNIIPRSPLGAVCFLDFLYPWNPHLNSFC
jgi:solute carrier family 26 (sodium-independent sulfate anion transporter), member 11